MQENTKKISNSVSGLLKVLGTVTIESLPEIVELTPVYGPLLSKALEKILEINGIYVEQKEGIQIQEQIKALKEGLKQEKITNDEFRNEFKNEIRKEIGNYLKKEEYCIPAYMSGIVVYVDEAYYLDEVEIDDLQKTFSGEVEWEDEEIENHAESIREFLVEYLGNGDYNKDDDYYIIQDCVIVNFFTDWGKPERNDQIICQFIYDLNAVMQSEAFVSYTVF